MKRPLLLLAGSLFLLAAGTTAAWSWLREPVPGPKMTGQAASYLDLLDDEQRAVSLLPYETPQRIDWHFIPKDSRKGLQIKQMNPQQRQAALALLRSCLSEVGYDKATRIMALESLLYELEKGRQGGPIRDPERYYFTLFGQPSSNSRWGLSIEGHHLSLNFVVDKDQVISSTPTFFAANPALVQNEVPGTSVKKGTRVLAQEELLAFELLKSLTDQQRAKAVIADKAPAEIRAAGSPQPPADEGVGLQADQLDAEQTQTLLSLIRSYAGNLPESIASARLADIDRAGLAQVRFAWAGADKPGVGHYYRIQGPTFLIEFVNTQPDAAGNPANHIHCVWRDMAGDFAIPVKG
ncbi:MAG: DUF3500 domain-containing protein [Pirellulaceae bacterium]|nr:DUF3500 domain-containing protein [Pirellulaceae bacterium]